MLSYPIEEAEELLTSKLSAAKTSMSNCEDDLDFIREQITVRSHGRFAKGAMRLTNAFYRRWKSLQQEYITGR